jgi:hypothetical protein
LYNAKETSRHTRKIKDDFDKVPMGRAFLSILKGIVLARCYGSPAADLI